MRTKVPDLEAFQVAQIAHPIGLPGWRGRC
jgi:hypothetical protein